MDWNAKQYDHQHDFVFKYGSALLGYLPRSASTVLDIGCGTGELTHQIQQLGHRVTGIDQSAAMIHQATYQFPEVNFQQGDILHMPIAPASYDVIFSNAVFHWIADQQHLTRILELALKPGGRLICEFGAQGNIKAISDAFGAELAAIGKRYRSPFYFPSVPEYTQLLKTRHFIIVKAREYPRPTVLKGGWQGLRNWIRQFFAADLAELPNADEILDNMEARLKPILWRGDHWEADYRRIQVIAQKQSAF